MIPKLIHYSWFSGEAFPSDVEAYISTWKKLLPDYEFVLWDMDRLMRETDSDFVREAIQMRKWAFAADYTRLFAINKYGGIWLDTDVELFKNIDRFLADECFIGKESWVNTDGYVYLTSHFMGAVKGHPFIKECLDYYEGRHFVTGKDKNGSPILNQTTISHMQAQKATAYGLDWRPSKKDKPQTLSNGVKVYPSYYFCRPLYKSIDKVYGIHRVSGGWRDKKIYAKSMTDPKPLTAKVVIWRILHYIGLR